MSNVEQMVQAVKDHALEHYNDGGWDVIVECWDDAEITEAIVGFREYMTVETSEQAIAAFGDGVVSVWADRQADARNSAF
jgi:hypothetical protein